MDNTTLWTITRKKTSRKPAIMLPITTINPSRRSPWARTPRPKPTLPTLYTSRKTPQHLLATGVPSCEEPGSAHEQTCKISREELPHPIKQRRDELRKKHFFVSLPLQCRLLILVDSCAEWGWPDTLGTIQGESSLEHAWSLLSLFSHSMEVTDLM